MAEMSAAEITEKIIDRVIDNIVKDIKDEEEYFRNISNMNDPYYMGYVDALDYIAAVIRSKKSKEK